MGKFESGRWRDRAWVRYGRCSSRPGRKSQERAARSWTSDCLAILDLERVVDWCSSRGISVDFDRRSGGIYHIGQKKITISGRLSPLNQLIILLHECGHSLIGDNEHHGRFGLGYSQTDPKVIRTFKHRVTILDEEMDAWYRGWKLAKRLDLSLDKEAFDRVRLQCLKTYLFWSIRPGPTPLED